MSAALSARPEPQVETTPRARLEASAQLLDFDPGLYSVEVGSGDVTRAQEGVALPCIRLDPLPTTLASPGRAFVATMAETGMVMPGAHAAYLRVERGRASVLLTIYKLAGVKTGPDVRIRLIGKADGQPVVAPPQAPAPPIASLPLTVLAHVERGGDVTAPGGAWVGRPGSGTAIEGFAVMPAAGIAAADLEYQAVLGTDWNTPWVLGGAFCGSRGLALPLLGLRIRLTRDAARRFRCQYWASFAGRGEIGPVEAGEVCTGDGAPLESLRVSITEVPQNLPAPKPPALKHPVLKPTRPASSGSAPVRGKRPSGK
jgi:hypothetical protein